MDDDVDCPYCGKPQEINHDDGYGLSEDLLHEQQCGDCEKYFTYRTIIHFTYRAKIADCLNGGEHELEKVIHAPVLWPDWKQCKNCPHEERGEYKPEEFKK